MTPQQIKNEVEKGCGDNKVTIRYGVHIYKKGRLIDEIFGLFSSRDKRDDFIKSINNPKVELLKMVKIEIIRDENKDDTLNYGYEVTSND